MMKKILTHGAILVILFVFLFASILSLNLFAATSTYTWKNVAIVGGGFIPGIIYSEAQSGLAYVRTDMGGAYRRDPGSNTWVPLTDWISQADWNLNGIRSLAADPTDPNRVYMACGTYTNSWTDQNGAILRSNDKGATWQTTPMPFKIGGNMPGRGCGEPLAIDPNKSSILFFGAAGDKTSIFGLWKSTDYGATWAKVTSFPNVGNMVIDPADPNDYLDQIQGIDWVTFDPRTGTAGTATQTIYVGVSDKSCQLIYRSTDGGATWAPVPGQPTNWMCAHKGKLDPVNGYLYIAYSSEPGPYGLDDTKYWKNKGDLWRYNTATGAWTQISPVPGYPDPNDSCFYGYSGLALDKQHPGVIMVTGYNSWWPDTFIWRSLDCGATWTQIWDWTRYPARSFRYVQDVSISPWLDMGISGTGRIAEVSPKLGWMTESLEIDPFNSNKMMYGTGATLYGCDDLTAWDTGVQIHITVKALGIEETVTSALISPPIGAPLISGLYDITGFRHDNLNTVPAKMHNSGIGCDDLDYAELAPSQMFLVGKGDKSSKPVKTSAAYSTDGGSTWTRVAKDPTSLAVNKGGRCAVSAAGVSRVVWAMEDPAGVYYTTNTGTSWTASKGLTAPAFIASDRVNANKFYAIKSGTFYVSVDGGANFKAAATGLPTTGGYIKAVPGIEGDVWLATGSGGLWHSTNSGTSFTKLTNISEASNIGFGKAATGQNYMAIYSSTAVVSGVRGVYQSIDGGATWVRINDDGHQYGNLQEDITGDPRIYGRVYYGTNGRGIIYGDIQ
jgi:photosystem II stability/assembly factor-like uncharacterized protein